MRIPAFTVASSLTRLLAIVGTLLVLIFGTGAWVGMEYANRYAKGSCQIAMYELCLSEVSTCTDSGLAIPYQTSPESAPDTDTPVPDSAAGSCL